MALPDFHGTGRLTHDVEVQFAQNGNAWATIPLAFNSKRKDDSGQWVDDKVFFIRGKLFRQAAENAAESLARGTEVVVSGRLQTDQWEDKQTGEKRSASTLLIDSIGPSIRFATATVHKAERNTSAGDQGDPWGSAPPAGSGGFSDEPPF